MGRHLFTFVLLFLSFGLAAQQNASDSLRQLIANTKSDTARVDLMCDIGYGLRVNEPEKALKITSEAFSLSKKINYVNGQSRSLGTMAIIFRLMGNFPLALEYNLKRLELVEKSNNQKRYAETLTNIGLIYTYLEEYDKAIEYYYRSDSVLKVIGTMDAANFNLALNLGDVYDKRNMNDSAFTYFTKALGIARQLKDNNYEGMAMVGLGNSYLKTGQYPLSLANYQSGIISLKAAENDDLLCEAYIGLANLFKKLNQNDSSLFYAKQSFQIAKKDGFLPRYLDAAKFLSAHYNDVKNVDSSFLYLNLVQSLNDSINSKRSIRESQLLSSNEQARQIEIAENLRIAKEERRQQLQLLFIAIFIPGFFIITLILSRIKLPVRVIKIAGILSLLILFEYLTLLLHPHVKELTHHTPVLEMLIFVTIAAFLIPAHHRIENWLIKWLTKNRPLYAGKKLKIKRTRIIKETPKA
ncbi:MAG: tetratricopeptide repeat protein [Ferruginibacter sp.]|nr:tetratricopeptide repeat protein [Ferruginibacter sp.]